MQPPPPPPPPAMKHHHYLSLCIFFLLLLLLLLLPPSKQQQILLTNHIIHQNVAVLLNGKRVCYNVTQKTKCRIPLPTESPWTLTPIFTDPMAPWDSKFSKIVTHESLRDDNKKSWVYHFQIEGQDRNVRVTRKFYEESSPEAPTVQKVIILQRWYPTFLKSYQADRSRYTGLVKNSSGKRMQVKLPNYTFQALENSQTAFFLLHHVVLPHPSTLEIDLDMFQPDNEQLYKTDHISWQVQPSTQDFYLTVGQNGVISLPPKRKKRQRWNGGWKDMVLNGRMYNNSPKDTLFFAGAKATYGGSINFCIQHSVRIAMIPTERGNEVEPPEFTADVGKYLPTIHEEDKIFQFKVSRKGQNREVSKESPSSSSHGHYEKVLIDTEGISDGDEIDFFVEREVVDW